MTSELIFLIFLVLKFKTVISKIGGKTRAVRKPFLQYLAKHLIPESMALIFWQHIWVSHYYNNSYFCPHYWLEWFFIHLNISLQTQETNMSMNVGVNVDTRCLPGTNKEDNMP